MGFGWVWVPSTRVQVPIRDAQVQMWPYLFWCFHQKLWNEPVSPWLELNQVPSPCSITVLGWMKWGDCLTLGPCTHLWNKTHSTNWYWEWSFVVQLLSRVTLWDPPWSAARQASLSFTISRSLLKLMSIELVMPSNHLILCHPLLLLPSIFSSIRVFSNESALRIR